jgi:hypothetical protein
MGGGFSKANSVWFQSDKPVRAAASGAGERQAAALGDSPPPRPCRSTLKPCVVSIQTLQWF